MSSLGCNAFRTILSFLVFFFYLSEFLLVHFKNDSEYFTWQGSDHTFIPLVLRRFWCKLFLFSSFVYILSKHPNVFFR